MSAYPMAGSERGESPKRFFQVLRERACFHHRHFARLMEEAGFIVRRVTRQPNHANVWTMYLRRGAVAPGHEIAKAKRTIADYLRCPPKEVEAFATGDRVESAFIFAPGTPGTLSFCGGREHWLPEQADIQDQCCSGATG